MDSKEVVQVEFANDIYDAAVEAGYTKKKSQALAMRKIQLARQYDIEKNEAECAIRRHIPKRFFPDWVELVKDSTKLKAKLREMGFDLAKQTWEDICIFRERGRVIVEECVVGSERTDKQWVNMLIEGVHVASFTARVAHKKDPTLERELRQLSGGAYG